MSVEYADLQPSGIADATFRTVWFVRETRFRRHEISMLHRDSEDAIPLARSIWSVTCPDLATRDRLYGWLHRRRHRWTAWGEVAQEHGAHALSQHLLALVAADPAFGMNVGGADAPGIPRDSNASSGSRGR